MKADIKTFSTITCPICGHKKQEKMPTDACQYFYECEKCKSVLKPKQGDCCVYCSYGSEKCPSIQEINKCCVCPALFASTLPKPHIPTRQPKLCQRACKANATKEIV